jgi:hypothetical protein
MQEEKKSIRTPLPLRFHLKDFDKGNHAVEKSDTAGQQHKYIYGIASGIKLDAHGERMSQKCIKSFMSQANSGQVLLYPDAHGIKSSEDIGILTKAEITPDGDWNTEYRLYDESDGVDQDSVDKANKIWKQLKGLPPYTKPLNKGFSIEGYIPDGAIIHAEKDQFGNLSKRVIDNVELDGVVIVPRPAYNSIAQCCYKALGELPPHKREKLQKTIQGELQNRLQEKEITDLYYKKKWDIQEALENMIDKIMRKEDSDKMQQLEVAFDEFKTIMIPLIMQSNSLFVSEEDEDENICPYGNNVTVSKSEIYKTLLSELEKLPKIIKNIYGGKNV